MNLFDQVVHQAMRDQPEWSSLRAVVEKELLHHDILREMGGAGLLSSLTFIGGTCLRACYGSERLSEDLDFTGGSDFAREALADLPGLLVEKLQKKYSLQVTVREPAREIPGVDTWKMSIITRPERADLPVQRIHIDVCAVPSHDPRPSMLRNVYSVDMGTSGLILQAQSRAEILADKMIALAFRPNRIKHRDLWDIDWLVRQGVEFPASLLRRKIEDRRRDPREFTAALQSRTGDMSGNRSLRREFVHEMSRFLPSRIVARTVENDSYWAYLGGLVQDQVERARQAVANGKDDS